MSKKPKGCEGGKIVRAYQKSFLRFVDRTSVSTTIEDCDVKLSLKKPVFRFQIAVVEGGIFGSLPFPLHTYKSRVERT